MKDKKDALDVIYPTNTSEESTHKCIKCGRIFEEHDKDYLTFEGNVYVGEDSGIIGNNIPIVEDAVESNYRLYRNDINKTRICLACFMDDMNNIRNKTLDELKAKAEKTLNQIKQLSSDTSVDIPTFLSK